MRLRHRDGSWRYLEGVGRNLLNNPTVAGIVANVHDVTDRRQAMKELEAATATSESIIESANALIMAGNVKGELTIFNKTFEDLTGHKKADILGKPFMFLMPEEEREKHIATFMNAYNDIHVKDYEITILTSNGERKTTLFNSALIHDADMNPVVVGIGYDITERREVEKALHESEEELSAVLANVTDAVFRFTEGHLTWCNGKINGMLGYDKDEIVGVDVDIFMPSDVSLAELYEVVDTGLKKEGFFQGATKVRRKDGSVIIVEYSASPVPGKEPLELVGVARDITERLRMEEELRRSEEHFRALIENSMDAIAIIDADGTIRYESPSVERILGYKPEELVGRNALEFIHTDDMHKISGAFTDSVKNPGRVITTEVKFLHKDGSWRILEGLGNNLLDNPKVNGIVANYRDITERKRMEQQLQLAGRLAAIGELAAGVAHELNNPLAAVQAYAELLSGRDDIDETARSDVETIYSQAQRASRITGNLLSFARQYKPQKQLVSINQVIEKSLELHEYRMRVNNIDVVTELAPDLPSAMADFQLMQQVFVNLITNAEQAMTGSNGGGRLVIKTQIINEMIEVTFSDDGPGVPDDTIKSVFDPFFTTKDVGKGTGLGLSICYGIVKEHGGNIYVVNSVGEGATFVVELPVASEVISTSL